MSRAPAKEAAPSGGVLPDPGARLWFMALCASVVVGSAWQIFLSRGGVLPAMLMIVCFVAAWWDAVARRIPNRLTYPLFLASLLVLAVAPDPQSVMGRWLGTVPAEQSLLGLGVFASVGLLCWRVGSMGGGDLKLLSAAAAALGMNQMTWILGLTLAGSALLMLAKWIWRGKVSQCMRAVCLWVYPADIDPPAREPIGTAPLAVSMAAAMLVAAFVPSPW